MSLQLMHSKIFEVRGQRVMLDFDLTELYQTETKYLKRAVRQNLRKFPIDFMFEHTKNEFENFEVQILAPQNVAARGICLLLSPNMV